jgi:alanine-glyoxylate transaminase / serine-glyoxylate transaminase / serine-pyruvate transaminase
MTMNYEPLPQRILMGPGPSNVNARVLQAMALPTIGHLDPAFTSLMDETMELLRSMFGTRNMLAFPVSGTGSAGMEACFVNVLQPGDRVLVGVNGVFGERMCDVARRCGAEVTRVEAAWGSALDPEAVRRAAREARPRVIAFVQAETSTGVLQPVEGIAAAAREAEALLLMDCVTSLGGGAEVKIDGWGVDLAYSGTQKCLSCPPGLAPVTFGERALAALDARKAPVQSWYLDLSMIRRYWTGERFYHHTAPINMLYGLRESLRLIAEEGLPRRVARHRRHAEALWAGLEAMGMRLSVPREVRLPSLTTVEIPEGAEDVPIRQALLREASLEIGGGLGPGKGKLWRIGLMGETSTAANVLNLLSWLERILKRTGVKIGSGLEAAQGVLESDYD